MTVAYNQKDQSDYYKERCYQICLMAGVEPFLINAENVEDVEDPLYLTVSGNMATRLRNEISNILLFAETIGYVEDDLNA